MFSFKLQESYPTFAQKLKQYTASFNPSVILDSCNLLPQYYKENFKIIVGFGGNDVIEPASNKIDILDKIFYDQNWYFGVIGYNIKNEIENLNSENDKCFGWNEITFFKPDTVITIDFDNNVNIYGKNIELHIANINKTSPLILNHFNKKSFKSVKFENKEYIYKVNSIKNEIINGNVYELNLCERFLYEKFDLANPFKFYENLIEKSPTPYSAYFSLLQKHVMSASPERFIAKTGKKIISQPIKGTIGREKIKEDDDLSKINLRLSEKDRAENVMIVDLVRNDFAKIAKPASIIVDELFGIYSYSQVHQMVSSVSAELKKGVGLKEIIKATFPMGSMTGTPKIAAMQFIERFENFDREWYSGALGYITPWGNFDFSVLIRTAFYDAELKKLAYYSGGAITIDSDPKKEFDELNLKTQAINQLLQLYY